MKAKRVSKHIVGLMADRAFLQTDFGLRKEALYRAEMALDQNRRRKIDREIPFNPLGTPERVNLLRREVRRIDRRLKLNRAKFERSLGE